MPPWERLGVDATPVCLIIGAVAPYKGLEEAIAWWRSGPQAARLAIVGKPSDEDYAANIRGLTGGAAEIDLRLAWLTDEELGLWLSAADCILFNYRTILTSGAACLARSWGVPLLIPRRLDTVDLGEPDSHVLRFESFETDFQTALQAALQVPNSFDHGAQWREQTGWANIAKRHLKVYESVLGRAGGNVDNPRRAQIATIG